METVADILGRKRHPPPSVGPRCAALEAARLMQELEVGALVVRTGAVPLGVFSEREAVGVLGGGFLPETPVQEIMRIDFAVVAPIDPIGACLSVLHSGRAEHAVAMTHGEVAGIVSIADIAHALQAAREQDVAELLEYIARVHGAR